MIPNCSESAACSTWTVHSRQQGSEGHEGCNALCHRARPIVTTQISNANHRKCSRATRIQARFLAALMMFLLSLGVCAEGASYQFDSDRDLLFDRRTIPTIQGRQAALFRRNIDSAPSHMSLPSPFDASLGNNFTSSACPTFFETFLHNATFQKCLPFSLLLQTSNGFFEATRSKTRLTTVLDATCNVDYQQCSALMANYAEQIQSSRNCGADLKLQNPLVEQAYNGFIAYDPMYRAGCLKDANGNFCFADAATNTSSPASSYIYYLPLGMQLPSTAMPTCNNCLRNTMAVLATYANDADQPLSSDYTPAAQHVESYCGLRHVKVSVESTSGVSSSLKAQSGLVFWIPILVLLSFLL